MLTDLEGLTSKATARRSRRALRAAATVVPVLLFLFAAPADRAAAHSACSGAVNIPDANLREEIRTAIPASGRPAAGATITHDMLNSACNRIAGSLTVSLEASNGSITNLTGMEHVVSINTLLMNNNQITDLTPLAGLTNLTTLELSNNRITDISALSRLTNLTRLLLAENRISSVAALSTHTRLQFLALQENDIRDLSGLSRLTNLSDLNISRNPISTLAPIAGLTAMVRLRMTDAGVSDISALSRHTSTEQIHANGNRIASLAPLRNLTSLTHLYLNGNRITNLTPLAGRTSLNTLYLGGNEALADISTLSGLTGLQALSLQSTSVADISPLASNTGLTGGTDIIWLRNNPRLNAQAATHVTTLRGRSVTVNTNTPITLDRQVRGARLTPGVESLTVSWNAVTAATGFTPTGYLVQWRSGLEALSTSATPPRHHEVSGLTTTSYTITGLQPGTQYQVRVRTRPYAGADENNRQLYAMPLAEASESDDPAEAARTEGVTVRAGVEQLSVSWEPVADASGYKVQWKSGRERYDAAERQAQVTGGETTSHTISGLTADVEYTVRVIATRTNDSDGEPSEEATGTPLRPPVKAAVGDAEVKEGGTAKLMVELEEPAKYLVTVTWSTADGSAKAGADYRGMTGSLRFEPGADEAEVKVPTLQDRRVEPAETFRVLLKVSGADAAAATVTIIDDDTEAARGRALGMALAGMGRWVAADAVAVIAERLSGRPATAQASVGGQPIALGAGGAREAAWPAAGASSWRPWLLPEEVADSGRALTAAELLTGSRIDLPLSYPESLSQHEAGGAPADAVAGWRIWAQGAGGGFANQPADDARIDGSALGGYLGVDFDVHETVLVGVALAHSRGGADYTIDAVTKGKADLVVTSALPYARWRPLTALEVWGLGGLGLGTAVVQDEAGRAESGLLSWLGAAGVRHRAATWLGIDVGLQLDGYLTEMRTGASDGLPPAAGDARRLRLRLEGRRPWQVSAESRLTPRLEVGGRWDGGSGGAGLGLEVGGGVAYAHRGVGLEVEAQGRYLVVHEQPSLAGEWGGGLRVKWHPGQGGAGPWLTLAPGWGVEESQVAQLWDGQEVLRVAGGAGQAEQLATGRLALEAGWGLAAPGGAGLLTPYAGLSLAGQELRDYRLGARLAADGGVSLGLEGRQSAAAGTQATLYGRLDW